jgi:hypothetical protein
MCDICEDDTSEPVDDKFGNVCCPACQVKSNTRWYADKLDELSEEVDKSFKLAEETVGVLEDSIVEVLEAIPYLGKCHLLGLVHKYKDMRERGVFECYRIDLYEKASVRLGELLK